MAALTAATPAATFSFGPVERVLRRLQGWWLVRRTERELAELSPRQLADIGLDSPRLPRRYRQAMLDGMMLA
jgi:uncharacterized protein YjiS (DUF1127 family)